MRGLARAEQTNILAEDFGRHAPRIEVRRFGQLGGLELWSMYNWFRPGCYSAPMLWISAPSSSSVHALSTRVDGRAHSCEASGAMMTAASDVCVVERIAGQLPHGDDCTFFSLAIPVQLLDPELEPHYQRRFRTRLASDPRPGELLRRLSGALLSGAANTLQCEELVSKLLATSLAEALPEERACTARIQKAREFIHVHWNEPFSLEDLARAVGITKWHLTRSFTAATGVSPSDYARTVRARQALAELQRGVPLAQVALNSGYADQAHMSREVRRIFGFTPGKYRKASAAETRRSV